MREREKERRKGRLATGNCSHSATGESNNELMGFQFISRLGDGPLRESARERVARQKIEGCSMRETTSITPTSQEPTTFKVYPVASYPFDHSTSPPLETMLAFRLLHPLYRSPYFPLHPSTGDSSKFSFVPTVTRFPCLAEISNALTPLPTQLRNTTRNEIPAALSD